MRLFERAKKWDSWQSWMKWWDAATGREVASFECAKNEAFTYVCLSPDGKTLAALNWTPFKGQRGDTRKLFLFSVPEKRLTRTVVLCEKSEGQKPVVTRPAFSPDGKWIAVLTRTVPEKETDDLDPHDVPQPRILLIEAASGAIRETMISPQCFSNDVCFSPDGSTLATGGLGRVLLWDMTKMPQ